MTHTTAAVRATTNTSAETRPIVHRSAGHRHGPITRLVSPGDIGELIKPFVFLDYFEMQRPAGGGFATHPHSGIATHTTLLQGQTVYWDSTGKSGTLHGNSIEWMKAGGGVWHGGRPVPGEAVRGYQLWVAMPPSLELSPPESHYLDAASIGSDGVARILLGKYGNLESRVPFAEPLTYLHVRLENGRKWVFQPPAGHDVAWLATHAGRLHVSGAVLEKEIAVFASGDGSLEVTAEGEAEFVLGSARKHGFPLVTGYYSVHTAPAALVAGEAGIRELGNSDVVRALRQRDAG
jgi:redox-sensitive bicupin YhaK (pirin superfamily)